MFWVVPGTVTTTSVSLNYLEKLWAGGGGLIKEVAWPSGLGRWTCNLEIPGSNPPPCHSLDLFSVIPISTSWLGCVNSQLVCLLPVGIFKHFLFIFIVKRNWIAIEIALYK